MDNRKSEFFDKKEELKMNQDRFQIILENLSDTVAIIDEVDNICYCTPNNEKLFGWKQEEVLGKNSLEFLHPDDRELLQNKFKGLISDGENAERTGDFRCLHRNGTELTIKITAKNLLKNKAINGILVTFKDITERKSSEKKLLEEYERYYALIESTNDLIWVVDPIDYKLLKFNSAFKNHFKIGRGLDIKFGMVPEEILPNNLAEVWRDYYAKVKKDGSFKIEHKATSRGIILLLSINLIKTDDEIIAISVFGQDITERKQMENSLRKSTLQLERILNNLQDAYFQADTNGNIIFVNPIALKMYAYNSMDEIMGKPAELLYADRNDRLFLINELRSHNAIVDYCSKGLRKDGTTFWASMNVQFVLDDDGNIIGTEGAVRDISERKDLEENLEKHRENLEASNKKLSLLVEQSIKTISKIGELRDAYTAGHQRRTADLACAIAQELGLTADEVNNIFFGAIIHDIGKIYVSSDILNKPGKITNLEYQLIQTHAEFGYNIVKDIDFPCQIATMIHQHHERLDGLGYPQGLSGDQIILESRILAVSDVVEAMTSHRPYRPSLGVDAALEEIAAFKGSKYDCDVVDACIKLFREEGFAFKN